MTLRKMDKKILQKTFRNTIIAAIYIFLVSQIMQNGDKLFGKMENSIFAPFVFLLLFSLSAAIVGGLVFGQSVILFFDNKKSESIKAAIYSICWMAIYTALGLIFLITS